MRPLLGVSRPASNPSKVDLPEPEAPTIASASPGLTRKPISCRMVNVPSPLTTVLPSETTSTSGISVLTAIARLIVLAHLATLPLLAHAADTILVVGDSISSGYGLRQREAWPALLEQRLAENGYQCHVINASISGDTSAGGRARLAASLATHRPRVVIIALGGNDGLRGLPPSRLRENLSAMAAMARAAGALPVIAGMEMPPNFGASYRTAFHDAFRDAAHEAHAVLVPFLLEGFGSDRTRFQTDGIHPNAIGQRSIIDTVWATLRPVLESNHIGAARRGTASPDSVIRR